MSQIYIELNVNELVHQKKNVNELIFFITKKKKNRTDRKLIYIHIYN